MSISDSVHDTVKTDLSEDDKRRFRAELFNSVHRELHRALLRMEEEEGLSQAEIARKLNVHPSVVSRRFNGTANLTLEVLADISRAMMHRVEVKFVALKDLARSNSVALSNAAMTVGQSSQPDVVVDLFAGLSLPRTENSNRFLLQIVGEKNHPIAANLTLNTQGSATRLH